MTEQANDERFHNLWGRDMTDTERAHSDLRESGYNGWFNWETGEAESQAEVDAAIKQRWANNEAAGLTYTREHGWVEKEQER